MVALTELKLFQYLIYRGIIPKNSVSDYSVSKVNQGDTRNNVFIVKGDCKQLLIKQPKLFDDKNSLTFNSEIIVSLFVNNQVEGKTNKIFNELTDYYNKILFFEYKTDYTDLRNYILYENSGNVNTIANHLVNIFEFIINKQHQWSIQFTKLDLPEFKPFFISYDEKKLFKLLINENQKELAQFCTTQITELKEVSKIWDARNIQNSYILHGDLRPENILINNNEFSIIDWELACYGDILWDSVYFVGWLIYNYLLEISSPILNKQTIISFILKIEIYIKEEQIFNKYLAIVLILFIYQNPLNHQTKVYNLCSSLLENPNNDLSKYLIDLLQ